MIKFSYLYFLPLLTIYFFSCKEKNKNSFTTIIDSAVTKVQEEVIQPKEENKKPSITYRFIKKKEWQAQKDSFEGAHHLDILALLNRADTIHLKRLDSIIIPNDYSRPLKDYSPFPEHVRLLQDINKIIFFSYPTQIFAAYENGNLVLTGPTNMGRKSKPTPQGLFFTNWKAKKTISTIDKSWILKWNFNVHNKWGVGFHEYALPGYPASHSCMRLLEADAQFLYHWADQWILKNNHEILAYGTPVIIFGSYPFDNEKPWYQLVENPDALIIPTDSLNTIVQPYLQSILDKQEARIHHLSNNK